MDISLYHKHSLVSLLTPREGCMTLKANPNLLEVQRHLVQPKPSIWSKFWKIWLILPDLKTHCLHFTPSFTNATALAIFLLDREWTWKNESHSDMYDQHIKRWVSSRNHMSLSYIQKWPNKPIAYSCSCHLPQRQAGQGDKYIQKKSACSQRAGETSYAALLALLPADYRKRQC